MFAQAAGTGVADIQHELILFSLDDQKYGLDLYSVQRVVRIIEITPLPDAPETILGVFNLEGTIIPVIDTRRLLNLPPRETELSDQLVIMDLPGRVLALVVDAVPGVITFREEENIAVGTILPGIKHITGILKGDEELIFINDLVQLLSSAQDRALQKALDCLPEQPQG